MSKLLDRFLVRATVGDVDRMAPRMRRIRLTGDRLRDLPWTPGQHIRVHVGDWKLRTYSVWDLRDGEYLDLCVLDHPGNGPGAQWARDVHIGQSVSFTRPEGRLVSRDAPYHLFAGDETAAVAFGAILRALPAGARVHGVVEADEMLPLAAELRWVEPDRLLAELSTMELPAEAGVAYVAGEARACQAVKRHLISERGWPRGSVVVKPFWTPGKRGMD